MNNFPLGAASDPAAPYNQQEVTCPLCCGTGIDLDHDDGETLDCPLCDGSGTVLKDLDNE